MVRLNVVDLSECNHNNFSVLHPDIASEWDYDNNVKGPDEYSFGSNKKVHWICNRNPCGCHRWEATINNRVNAKSGCPYCSNRKQCKHDNLSVTHTELCKEWDYERNKSGPENYSFGSSKKVYWKCPKNPCGCHIYLAVIQSRTVRNRGCPYCTNQKLCTHNNLSVVQPETCKEWDYTKNKNGPENYPPTSIKKVWWKCPKDPCGCHNWICTINNRICNGSGCPYCSGHKICPHNNLLTTYPEICREWDYTKNKKGPDQYHPCSNYKVHWRCLKDPCGCHKWLSAINNRTTGGRNCPYCSNKKVCPHDSIKSNYPELSLEWDYELNDKGPEDYAPNSGFSAWWKCSDHGSWCTRIINRTKWACGCPICNESKGEKNVAEALSRLNIPSEREYNIQYLPTRRYDFYFEYNDSKWLIEYDGLQHFTEIRFFHKKGERFAHDQEIDKIKTTIACLSGYKLIRIDHTIDNVQDVKLHILRALELNRQVYYSNPEIYEWISNSSVDLEILLKEAPDYQQLLA